MSDCVDIGELTEILNEVSKELEVEGYDGPLETPTKEELESEKELVELLDEVSKELDDERKLENEARKKQNVPPTSTRTNAIKIIDGEEKIKNDENKEELQDPSEKSKKALDKTASLEKSEATDNDNKTLMICDFVFDGKIRKLQISRLTPFKIAKVFRIDESKLILIDNEGLCYIPEGDTFDQRLNPGKVYTVGGIHMSGKPAEEISKNRIAHKKQNEALQASKGPQQLVSLNDSSDDECLDNRGSPYPNQIAQNQTRIDHSFSNEGVFVDLSSFDSIIPAWLNSICSKDNALNSRKFARQLFSDSNKRKTDPENYESTTDTKKSRTETSISDSQKMVAQIRMKMNEMERYGDLNKNEITLSTVRSAFLLPMDAVIRMYYIKNEIEKFCNARIHPEPCFELPDDWQNIEFFVESDKVPSRPSTRPSTPYNIPETITDIKMDDQKEFIAKDINWLQSLKSYALYYQDENNTKHCVTPISTGIAATYAHGSHKKFTKEYTEEILVQNYYYEDYKVLAKVVERNDGLDVVILQAISKNFLDKNPSVVMPHIGTRYLMLGLSNIENRDNPFSLGCGSVTAVLDDRAQYVGSSGSSRGDSGAGVWNSVGQLIGMNIMVKNIPVQTSISRDNKQKQYTPAIGGSSVFLPAGTIKALASEYIPLDPPISFEE